MYRISNVFTEALSCIHGFIGSLLCHVETEEIVMLYKIYDLKFVSATLLLVCFVCLKESTCETRENIFYFTSKALFVLEIIKF